MVCFLCVFIRQNNNLNSRILALINKCSFPACFYSLNLYGLKKIRLYLCNPKKKRKKVVTLTKGSLNKHRQKIVKYKYIFLGGHYWQFFNTTQLILLPPKVLSFCLLIPEFVGFN